MNLQVISAPEGEILWRRGRVYDLTAARIRGIVWELAAAGLMTLADKGYTGAGEHVLTPYRGRRKPASQKHPGGPALVVTGEVVPDGDRDRGHRWCSQ